MVDIEYEKGNKRFYAFLNKDDHLIQGNFTKRQFQWAVYQYLQDNYSKVVNPMLKKKDLMTGELIYKDHKDLVKKLIKLYTDKYYGNVN